MGEAAGHTSRRRRPVVRGWTFLLASLFLVSGVAVARAAPGGAAAATTAARMAPHTAGSGWSGPGVSGFGDAVNAGGIGGMRMAAPAVALASDTTGRGYWVAAADGGVFSYGDAPYRGSLGALHLFAPIVGMAATPDGGGYWLVAMDGGVFSFGDAVFRGSLGGIRLAHSIVGMAATPDGGGYWLVAGDGGVFTFGDAGWYGSLGGRHLSAPVTGMAATPDGHGYWLVAGDGGVFTYGDARWYGSAAGAGINAEVVGLAPTADGEGYWLAAATGGVLTYGDAGFHGPTPNLPPFSPTAAIAGTPDGGGYWLLRPDEGDNVFSDPSPAGAPLGAAVAVAASQLGPATVSGAYCNAYGPCEPWCSLFATWVWNTIGVPIPRFPFTGSVVGWSAQHGAVLPPTARPAPGDGVMFGTGPQNASTSQHVGVVVQVWPDGAIVTVEGDSGPEPAGHYAVTIDGPFLPAEAATSVGMPVYAFVRP
ncbi:MAG TPA: CHAP domain-containing protein [Acidimicrobiales bacterium]|nr:CHAP domain-containing protein [Acidimicrobiales bacterium]